MKFKTTNNCIFLIFRERVDNGNCEDIDDDGISNYCDCIHTVINQFRKNVLLINYKL